MIRRLFGIALAAVLGAVPGHAKPVGEPGWSLFVDFTFTAESDSISDADRAKARRVSEYMARNPRLQVGLDGMNQGRVSSVRTALVGAGVPTSRIQVGAFAEPRLRGARRVLVMVGP